MTKTNSHTVQINLNESIMYGSIKFFIQVQEDLYIIIRHFTVEHTKIFYHTTTKKNIEHVVPIKNSDNLLLIKYDNIKLIMQLVRVGNYLCKTPNTIKKVW